MTKQTEALKLALEALELSSVTVDSFGVQGKTREAITALRETLAEQPRLLSAAPCDQCGYNGPGYYQPKTHPCASKHHKALAQERSSDEQPAPVQQEPYGQVTVVRRPGCVDQHWFYRWPEPPYLDNAAECHTVYTSPPAQRKPLHIGDESAAFKAWFDAWWVSDGEQGETIPTQSDKHFLTYMDQYTLGFGAWMAARHAAHGIKGDA